MAEIERKFLVAEMPGVESGRTEIEQGYLALDGETEVRLRRAGVDFFLTAKSGHGEVREEVEVPIDPGVFARLWNLTKGRRVSKTRHYVPLGEELRAEVDVYDGALAGLRTVEVEFDSREDAERFRPPAWFGEELTGDPRYANQTLATVGLPAEAGTGDDMTMESATDVTEETSTEAGASEGGAPPTPRPSRAAPTACSRTRRPTRVCAGSSSPGSRRRPNDCARPATATRWRKLSTAPAKT